MRSSCVLLLVLAASCGGDDEYRPPPSSGADANPNAPDANPNAPDANPNAPDAGNGGTNDGKGPTIAQVSPAPGTLVSGTMRITVTVTDPDGVAMDAVTATITGPTGPEIVTLAPSGTTEWSGTYDTRPLAGRVFPVIIVHARDRAGNTSELGLEVALDNQPPVAELDPPLIRETRIERRLRVCSESFDPVGDDAPSDGEAVAQLIELRARVVDQSNFGTATSSVLVPLAGIDNDRVELLVLDDSSLALIVDTNGDGVCDAVNPKIRATSMPRASGEAALVHLVAFDATGGSDFPGVVQDEFQGSNAALCATSSQDSDPPAPVCAAVDGMTRIASMGDVPMIYAPPPPPETDEACLGLAFDALANNIADGWACVAVRAVDELGNSSVSPALRICIDRDDPGAGGDCHAWRTIAGAAARPSCTGTYDMASDTVTLTPCTAREFATGGPGDYELISLD